MTGKGLEQEELRLGIPRMGTHGTLIFVVRGGCGWRILTQRRKGAEGRFVTVGQVGLESITMLGGMVFWIWWLVSKVGRISIGTLVDVTFFQTFLWL